MGISAHLIHTCTVERPSADVDVLGEDVPGWANVATGVRCRLVSKEQSVPFGAFAEKPVVTTYKLLIPAGTDIQPGDRITSIVFEDGSEDETPDGETHTYRIESVLPRRGRKLHHTTLNLERTT